jgi:hypothetical protein
MINPDNTGKLESLRGTIHSSTPDPLLQAVEIICLAMLRRMGTTLPPYFVRNALSKDTHEYKSAPPSLAEAEALIEVVIMDIEPRWVTKKWPRTLGVIQQRWNAHPHY